MERIQDPFEERKKEVKKEKREAFGKKEKKKENADAELQKVLEDITDEEATLAQEVAKKRQDTRPYGE